jgi:hypothetical protein
MVFESVRRLIVAIIYIIGLGFSFLIGVIGPFNADSFGTGLFLMVVGFVSALLTFATAALVNWIFQQ